MQKTVTSRDIASTLEHISIKWVRQTYLFLNRYNFILIPLHSLNTESFPINYFKSSVVSYCHKPTVTTYICQFSCTHHMSIEIPVAMILVETLQAYQQGVLINKTDIQWSVITLSTFSMGEEKVRYNLVASHYCSYFCTILIFS